MVRMIEREVVADVTVDRWKYIGGSDVPAIMGLSPWKAADDLLEEKVAPSGDRWGGNELTQYGHDMEPVIRDRVNGLRGSSFEDGWRCIDGCMRYHADGVDWGQRELLEVKTTGASGIRDGLGEYKLYLVQMLFGMKLMGLERGVLAVYERPDDLSLDLDDARLHVYEFDIADFGELARDVERAVAEFAEKVERRRKCAEDMRGIVLEAFA